MKKIRNIMAVCMSAAILLSCSACSKGMSSTSESTISSAPQPKPYDVYLASTQKTSALTSSDSDFTIDMSIAASGTTTSIKSSGNSKMVTNGSDAKYLVHSSSQILGQTIDTDSYYDNNYLYLSMAGQKIKEKMDLSTFKKSENQSILSSNLDEKDFDTATITQADGSSTIDVTLSDEDAQKIFDSAASSILSKLQDGDSLKFQYSNVTFEITVNPDGYVKTINANCTITMSGAIGTTSTGSSSASDSTMKMDMKISSSFNNPGQDVTVTPPSDLSEYKETAANTNLL